MTERSIEELVAAARQNDQMAINELYGRTANKAFFVAKRIMSDEDQIADIIQESYVKAFCNLDKLESPDKFQGWLDTIVVNKCKDYLKKKKPLLFTEIENDDNDSPLEFEDTTVEFSPEATVDYNETKRLVGEMIEQLPEDQKMCLLLFHYEEKSLIEIAEIMDCSVNTVKSRLNYARKNLKKQVLDLEKKGTKLYCMPLVPFLYWFFRQSLLEALGGTAAGAAVGGAAATGAAAAAAGATAAGTGAGVEAAAAGAGTGAGATTAGTGTGTATAGAAATGAGIAGGATVGAGTAGGAAVGAGTAGAAAAAGTTAATAAAVAGKAAGLGFKKFLIFLALGSAVAVGGNKVYQKVVLTPEHTIEQFERGYNEWDLDKMMKCMDPEIQKQYRSVRGIASLFGVDPSELFAGTLGLMEWSGSEIDIGKMDIEILDVTYTDSTHAVVTVNVKLGSDPSKSETAAFQLQKIEGKWFIME